MPNSSVLGEVFMGHQLLLCLKGNSRTTQSYRQFSLPITFINRAINHSLHLNEDLSVEVEVIPDIEFNFEGGKRYYLKIGDAREETFLIPEAHLGSFVDICIEAVIEFLISKGIPFPYDLHSELNRSVHMALDAQPDGETLQASDAPQGKSISYVEKMSGIKINNICLIVKVKSLEERFKGGLEEYISNTDSSWVCDYHLLGTCAAALEDLNQPLEMLQKYGLQAEWAPADFYLIEQSNLMKISPLPVEDEEIKPRIFTMDDNALKIFLDTDKKNIVCLKCGE